LNICVTKNVKSNVVDTGVISQLSELNLIN